MALIRSLLFLILATLVTIPIGMAVVCGGILPLRFRFRIVSLWYKAMLALCRVVIGLDYRVDGREKIPTVPCVVLCKHQSAWETIVLQALFTPSVFVMKKSLLMIPFLGWGLAAAKMISIDRDAGKDAIRRVTRQGKERLNAGLSVIIYPEGTRTAPGEKRPFKRGGAFLAMNAGVPVVPVAHNAGMFWGKNAFVKEPGVITVSIGEPIDTKGRTPKEITDLAEQWVDEEMRRLLSRT
ncbi:MAG: 1-acyl-sn-glycerol-3-phosphate acyltransferase, partial [Candidatus Accumulibacter sp.]|nr:1-acyl-sn-glycerol-3-phosphate acyltransferase [Accumulibacter sp.]